jgi:hypothetical protein
MPICKLVSQLTPWIGKIDGKTPKEKLDVVMPDLLAGNWKGPAMICGEKEDVDKYIKRNGYYVIDEFPTPWTTVLQSKTYKCKNKSYDAFDIVACEPKRD